MRPMRLEDDLSKPDGEQRFFIKLDAPYPVDDHEGQAYPSVDAAREDAVRFLADVLKDRAREVASGAAWQVLVYDEDSAVVCRIGFTADFPN